MKLVNTCTIVVAVCSVIAVFLNWNTGKQICHVPGFSWSTDVACDTHQYKTQIVSLEPLVVYIENFVGQNEAQELLRIGQRLYSPSRLSTGKTNGIYRSSQSAGLPPSEASVACVGKRALGFMGTIPGLSTDFGIPQLVNYQVGQRYDLHYDWYREPMRYKDGRFCNRGASLFVFLETDCTGGETYFPRITSDVSLLVAEGKAIQNTSFEGVMFKPIKGNALFWVNLHSNGTGDERVLHGGLPVQSGKKTGMNIWPPNCLD